MGFEQMTGEFRCTLLYRLHSNQMTAGQRMARGGVWEAMWPSGQGAELTWSGFKLPSNDKTNLSLVFRNLTSSRTNN